MPLIREQEALENCRISDQVYLGKVHRILGDKHFRAKKYSLAIDYYFQSELGFEEVMRLVYTLYKKDRSQEFALQMLKYFKILLNKLENADNGNTRETR